MFSCSNTSIESTSTSKTDPSKQTTSLQRDVAATLWWRSCDVVCLACDVRCLVGPFFFLLLYMCALLAAVFFLHHVRLGWRFGSSKISFHLLPIQWFWCCLSLWGLVVVRCGAFFVFWPIRCLNVMFTKPSSLTCLALWLPRWGIGSWLLSLFFDLWYSVSWYLSSSYYENTPIQIKFYHQKIKKRKIR